MSWFDLLVAVPALILLNGFFVAAEYVVVTSRPGMIELLRAAGHRGSARALERLRKDPARALAAVQVCITMTNLLLGWIGEPAMGSAIQRLFSPVARLLPASAFATISTILAFALVTLLTVVLSELLPKALTLRHTVALARLTAVPVGHIMRLARPLVWLLNAVGNLVTRPLGLGRVEDADRPAITAEEIRQATLEAAADGVVTAAERKLVLNSLALGLRKARQIMVPRVRVTYLDVQWSMDENRRIIGQHLYSRIPVCDGGMDRIIGILHTKEFLTAYNAEADSSVLRLIARPAVFAPDTIGVDRLLALFNVHTTETILLVDETGGVEGLVTLQDVVDELVGDTTNEVLQRQITGELPLHELAQRIGRPTWASGEEVVSVGGLLAARLGRIPKTGDEVEVDGVRLRVLNSDGRAVREIEILNVAPRPLEAQREEA